MAAGAVWVVTLRQGLTAGWGRFRLLAALALVLAAALAALSWLELAHHEILDLGFRAVFPAIYRPFATAPRTACILAGISASAGAVLFLVKRGIR